MQNNTNISTTEKALYDKCSLSALYPRSKESELDLELFKNPTKEYRAAPFWAWNNRLEPEKLVRQIEQLKEMGFGGFHMHSRTGMSSPYLGEEFMDRVKLCVEKARCEGMLAWLYDEDRWPSGSAGGLVTKDIAYRARHLIFTPNPYRGSNISGTKLNDTITYLARYSVLLDADGCLHTYRRLSDSETPDSNEAVWYAYQEIGAETPWFNNQTYVNTLDKASIDRFIQITYETYEKAVGADFGGLIPAIFTDEPQFTVKTALGFAAEQKAIMLPWTDNLPETFFQTYGEDLLDHLPELIWNLPDEKVSQIRYHFHDHIAMRFAEAYADNCGAWCRAHGLKLTGHMMEEPTLLSQTASLGEAMRSYRGFDLPGIDILMGQLEYTTAKQAQSAVHQYGREGMLSEMYGVTGWQFDFRGHKAQGDWQAALGVTVRVPHLSLLSMEGDSKRDYPASIHYQSPWYLEYTQIENHFARLNTALTRGKPCVRIGVIHPVESYWLHWGPMEQTAAAREQLERRFQNITDWLIFGQLDFDFICESLLPEQCPEGGSPLCVGEMTYDTLILPSCETLRATTAERLRLFVQSGGRLLILGQKPHYIDAGSPDGALDFLQNVPVIPFEKNALLQALEPVRFLDIRGDRGERTDQYLTQLRKDGEGYWLFIAGGRRPGDPDMSHPQHLTIRIKGQWQPTLYNTMSGDIYPLNAVCRDSVTEVKHTLYTYDSLLLYISPGMPENNKNVKSVSDIGYADACLGKADITLEEPNVLVLDMAEYALDGGDYRPREEILRLVMSLRRELGIPTGVRTAQPWTRPPETPVHRLRLRFTVHSEQQIENSLLALEKPENTVIIWDGKQLEKTDAGYYVDEAIRKIPLPSISAGTHTLELDAPLGQYTVHENVYILGDFGVCVAGTECVLTAPVRQLAFGDIVHQGLPFYGGNIQYHIPVNENGNDILVHVSHYRGALIGVSLDGQRVGSIIFDPYVLRIPAVPAGKHQLTLTLFGNRYNTFGELHLSDNTREWHGPDAWRTSGDAWSYEYRFKPTGILKSPVIITE